jgi:hypothetical protein
MNQHPLGGKERSHEAHELNFELMQLVAEAGRRMGFDVRTEYPVPGGRLDVVWSLKPKDPIPHFDGTIPVVGFEIESSWRTRKHVKGDLLNLQDCGVALGVIVLAGSRNRDDSLRTFARTLVDRAGVKVLVWTEEDVRALAARQPVISLPLTADEHDGEAPTDATPVKVKRHSGKYGALWTWLVNQERRSITVTFSDIEQAIGMPLPDSSRSHVQHWYGYKGSAVARAIIDAGWRASQVHLNSGTVTFIPVGTPTS